MSLKEALAELHPLLHEAFLATSGSLRAWKHPPEDGDAMTEATWDRPSNAYASIQRFKVARLQGAFLPKPSAEWYRDILENIAFVMHYGSDQPDEANRRINAIFQAREDVNLAYMQADDEPAETVAGCATTNGESPPKNPNPPQAEVKKTAQDILEEGFAIIAATRDNPPTVEALAKRLNLTRQTMYSEKYKPLVAGLKAVKETAQQGRAIPRGSKSKDGDFDAWE